MGEAGDHPGVEGKGQHMNKAILTGYLGEDPKTRDVNGDTVCNMRLATTDVFNKKDGSRGERTDWHTVVVWGPQGASCGKYLKTGSHVAVEGQIQTRSWEKDGEKRYVTEIRALHVEFLDRRPEGERDRGSDRGEDRGDDRRGDRRDDRRQSGPSDNRGSNDRRPDDRSRGGGGAPRDNGRPRL